MRPKVPNFTLKETPQENKIAASAQRSKKKKIRRTKEMGGEGGNYNHTTALYHSTASLERKQAGLISGCVLAYLLFEDDKVWSSLSKIRFVVMEVPLGL
jgi:hypothetical protein